MSDGLNFKIILGSFNSSLVNGVQVFSILRAS